MTAQIINGALENPDFHDGFLRGISTADDILSLSLKTYNGISYTLRVPGLVSLCANNFLDGNIILEVSFYTRKECPPDLVFAANWINETGGSEEYKASLYKEFVDKNWSLIEILPSYGCELYAVFSEPLQAVNLTLDS